jgi:uncharacterized integral membrane protein (TIGR00697 family)
MGYQPHLLLEEPTIYRIVGMKENYQENKNLAVNIQVNNSARSFWTPVKDIYSKDWLKYFSKEDCTYLAVLYIAEKENKPEIIKHYPRKRSIITTSVLLLAVLYTAFLIISNLAGSKIIDVGGFTFPAVLIFFPFTYIIDDIITEVYGFEVSRKVIWGALFANLIVILSACAVTYMKPSSYWQDQKAFEGVFLSSPRILIASLLAYVCGEFLNAVFLAKLKVYTKGKYLWFRSITSTMAGCFFDSIIFCTIAFAGIISIKLILLMICTQYIVKTLYAFLAIPFIYKITAYLKDLDKVDVYDYTTKYNPFSV